VSKGTAEYLVFADSQQEILEMLGGLFAKPSKLIEDLMDPLKKHKKVPFDDWAALLGYLTKIRSMLKEVRRLKVFHLFDTVSNIDAITEKMPSDAVRRWMTACQNLPDGQQGASFEKFVTDEWAYATTVVSRVTSPEQALKTLGVSGGGGGGNAQNSGNGGAGGKFNWRDKRANKNGGGGSNQVPVGPAQPNGGGGQAAQKTAVTAAGTVNGNGNQNQNANSQNVQKGNQHQKNNQRQNYANYSGNNGGGGANEEEPFQCRVDFCARKERHFVDRCDIFPTLPMTRRWAFIRENNLCTYCLKHSTKLVCFKAANEKGPFPCGIEGCTEIHHPWLHCYSAVKGHVGLRLVTMRPEEPQVEPRSESMAAGAKTVSQIVLEPADSDNETNDQFNFDADSKGGSDEEMSTEPEPEEPQVEREKTPTEPAEPEPEEVEPQEQEELEPQFSPVEESSHSDSYESDSTASTSASSVTECDSGNDS
jgi:hypothetical protein